MRRPVWAVGLMAAVALGGLSACDGRSAEERTVERTGSAASTTTSDAASAAPTSAAADFVGVWAARSEDCSRNQTWRFTPDRLAAAGGTNCAIEGAARAPQGWRLQASCTSGGVSRPSQLDLVIDAAAGGGMTVAGGPFGGPVSLVRCTPPLNAPVVP